MKKISSSKNAGKKKVLPSPDDSGASQNLTSQKAVADFSRPFILSGKSLQVKINGHPIEKPVEKNFQSEKELQELILQNNKTLFGEDSFVLDTRKTSLDFTGGVIPDGILLDLKEAGKPKFYLVLCILSKRSLSLLFVQLTHLFSLLRNQESQSEITEAIGKIFFNNKSLKKELKAKTNGREISEVAESAVKNKPGIILLMDSVQKDMPLLMETYAETWGKFVKPIFFRKFSSNGETIITMHPDFAQIQNGKAKSKSEKEKINYTEEYHTEDASDDVKTVYRKMKAELLKTDKTLQFNPQKYYISMRKNRNLAFFHIGKNKISLVVMNPDKDTRKQIKHHEVKTLAESVQKFWNGKCCTIMIENSKHINDIISLLKKLVAGA